jgi:hypothetical protein
LELKRVAVLPLTSDERHPDSAAGEQTLEPVLHSELLRSRRFEIVSVSPQDLRRWTGRKRWEVEEKLPPGFFEKLRAELGCNAVLFCRLSRFHAYPPLAVGWKLTLVDAHQLQTLWSIDEVFDAGEPAVANSARRYQREHERSEPQGNSGMILTSPRRFGQYTAWAALSTLPQR